MNLADHEQGVFVAKNNMRIWWVSITLCRVKDGMVDGKTRGIMHLLYD